MKALFISRVSPRHLGPNVLTLLMREEERALQRARHSFTVNDILYDIRTTPGSDWQAVSEEIDGQEHDILIIQGEFAEIWQKDHRSPHGPGAISGSANRVWIIGAPEEPAEVPARPGFF